MPRRGLRPWVTGRGSGSAHLATQGLRSPQWPPCCVDSTCPSSLSPEPRRILPSSEQQATGHGKCALSLIGTETHSPPFSCRWGFHRKKLLLCFPSLATVWKSDPHILLYWVKSLLDRLLPIIGWSEPTGAPVRGLPWQSYLLSAGTSWISSEEDGLAWESC